MKEMFRPGHGTPFHSIIISLLLANGYVQPRSLDAASNAPHGALPISLLNARMSLLQRPASTVSCLKSIGMSRLCVTRLRGMTKAEMEGQAVGTSRASLRRKKVRAKEKMTIVRRRLLRQETTHPTRRFLVKPEELVTLRLASYVFYLLVPGHRVISVHQHSSMNTPHK
jgi:hypothetical protein